MRRLGALAAALLLARASRAAPAAGPDSVWEPSAAVAAQFRAQCGDKYAAISSTGALKPLEDDARLTAFRIGHPSASLRADAPRNSSVEERPGGGRRFVFEIPFADCRACPDLAAARVAYDFDGEGRFVGPGLLTVADPAAFAVEGEVVRGKAFEASIDGLRTFRLAPFSEGWTIEVKDKDGGDYCSVVTPPYRGTNDLEIFGGNFRNADDTAPSAGRETRRFRCVATRADRAAAAKALDTVLWSDKASWKEVDGASEDHRRLEAGAQRGRLTVTRVVLGNAVKDGRPWIESMAFRFELFPPGPEPR